MSSHTLPKSGLQLINKLISHNASGSVSVSEHIDTQGSFLDRSASNRMCGLLQSPIGGISEAPVINMNTFGRSIRTSVLSNVAHLPLVHVR